MPSERRTQRDVPSTKSRMEKYGVKPGSKVSVVGLDDQEFLRELEHEGADVAVGRPRKDSDLIFFRADTPKELERLPRLEPYIKRNGAIWVIKPKGRPEIGDVVVIEAAIAAGLVDNKVVRFSDAYTSLRLVVPLARR